MQEIALEITAKGGIQMLHDDAVDLGQFGEIKVSRASHVEYSEGTACIEPGWYVQSAKSLGVLADGFKTRAEALDWEKHYYSPDGEGWAELTERA